MNTVCYERVSYERGLLWTDPLWTEQLWMWSVMNVICYDRGLFRVACYMNRSVLYKAGATYSSGTAMAVPVFRLNNTF